MSFVANSIISKLTDKMLTGFNSGLLIGILLIDLQKALPILLISILTYYKDLC